MHKLRINPIALEDMHDIKEYITKEFDDPTAAVDVITNIMRCYGNLKDFPLLGIELSSKIDIPTDYRYLICGNYIVFYKNSNDYVSIYRILYSRRDYVKILFGG
ncbi:plasmid stabilization system protein ParE [Oikeobacillus pervagus]|uniref:Plasmid stabilization system protein ParE n=1 Tax=Oikeobacillus pervagus TaxID=1325931 RepID=A0AAJ1WLK0_9BACI|nr:type II toxin-antitoxin system RelE/ParE family toxin [Oikeobacillus pervagus]MDQ0216286.1 plasmid stabilization system protein ParE [Oikeobacillus pervagus]